MKKLYLLLFSLLLCPVLTFAQGKGPGHKDKHEMFREVREFKMKFLAQEMSLREDQKKKFFELYEEMNKQKRACYKQYDELNKRVKQIPDASEEDYRKVREAEQEANSCAASVEKEYDQQFAEFLTEKQMYKMQEAEKEFRSRVQEMRHNNKKHKKQPAPEDSNSSSE